MNRILLVAATKPEIEPLLSSIKAPNHLSTGLLCPVRNTHNQIDILLTGAGMIKTAFHMGMLVGRNYNIVINAGVCGTFSDELKVGQVVNVVEDDLSELGAEDGDDFLPIDDIKLGNHLVPNQKIYCHPLINDITKVKGVTVNCVHGNEKSIEVVKQRNHPDVETMEGAAFLMAANHFKWEAVQLRSVSNKVERRNKEHWNLPLAIDNLNTLLIQLIESL